MFIFIIISKDLQKLNYTENNDLTTPMILLRFHDLLLRSLLFEVKLKIVLFINASKQSNKQTKQPKEIPPSSEEVSFRRF
jgi:hypothetical protein